MNRIITVGREFGSGGREIGRKIAEELGIAYYDHEIVTELIRRTNLAEEYIRSIEEKNPVPVFTVTTGRTFLSVSNPLADQQVSIFSEEGRIIQEMAEKSDCVIVGRRADYILRERKDVFNVFVHAPMAYRADRIVRLYGESERSPEQRLQDKDKKRRVNYKHYTGRDWGVSQNYHLSLDSADIGVDHCADVILYAMGLDPAKLPMPEGEKEHN